MQRLGKNQSTGSNVGKRQTAPVVWNISVHGKEREGGNGWRERERERK